jgi:hypothetical protein
MEDEIGEGVLRLLARSLYFVVRVLLWGAIEFIFDGVLWYIGWPLTRLVTFGRYPGPGFFESERATLLEHFLVALTAIVILTGTGWILASSLGYSW